ncbi:hypothetical protein PHISCL_00506 [Aspergillus sclerotialis]|uniref:DUF7730 domain-containing protein n=1 Tax=Aspergillus sclerotialis TaxID=2070753 RepID=A0A3A2ZXV8_9EURO|nr:hypothetical protein PHISCL_00506 [Aspergillus sclerotialis]
MPLSHSIEARRDYNASRRSAYPPPDLQIPSFRAVARKAVHRTRNSFQSRRSKKESPNPDSVNQHRDDRPPPRRRRPLTPPLLPLKDTTPIAPEAASQSQSPFFRLPLELREIIYKQVLGDSNIHIKNGKSLRHLRCKCTSCPGIGYYFYYGSTWKKPWECDGTKYDYDGDRLPVSLLRSCRRVYTEAIDLLYSSNIFSFRDANTLQRFLCSMPSQRKELITTIHMDLPFECTKGLDTILREETWDELVSLPSLRNMEFRMHSSPNGPEDTRRLVEIKPIERLRQNKNLEVVRLYLPGGWMGGTCAWLAERPFEVRPFADWKWNEKRVSAMMVPLWVF